MCARWLTAARLALCACAGAFLFSACGLFEDLPPTPTPMALMANRLQNPGFEDGTAPWTRRDQPEWGDFSISDSVGHKSAHSLALDLEGGDGDAGTHITGAIQTLKPDEFPDTLSGFYRVDDWRPNASFQYLQFVVIVHGGNFDDGVDLHEIRFIIAGADRQPFSLSNARFVFLSRSAPKLRQWTYFAYPVGRAFETDWGRVPTGYDAIDVFIEARYDGKTADQPATGARVFFDDLYLGTQFLNPNRVSR